MPRSALSNENINDAFPDYNRTHRGVDEPSLDEILYTKIRVNEANAPAAENVSGVDSVTSTLTYVEYTPEEVEKTSRLHEAS